VCTCQHAVVTCACPQDLSKKYGPLMPYVSVTLLQSGQAILTAFSENLQRAALDTFKQSGICLNTHRAGQLLPPVGLTTWC
jgi:NADH dehydrogenase FAD-containing subunit